MRRSESTCGCSRFDCQTCFPGPPVAGGSRKPRRNDAESKRRDRKQAVGQDAIIDIHLYLQRLCFEWKPSSHGSRKELVSTAMSTPPFVGCVSVRAGARLAEVRRAIEEQRPDIPQGFIFVRSSSSSSNISPHAAPGHIPRNLEDRPISPRARDFWPPGPLVLSVPGYSEGERLAEGESQTREFKSIAEPLERGKCKSGVEAVRGFLDRGYINAFLNTPGGGTLFCGIEDHSWRVRSHIRNGEYVSWTQKDLDQVLPPFFPLPPFLPFLPFYRPS